MKINKLNESKEEPPELINGSGIPIVGNRPKDIPILIVKCEKSKIQIL